MLGILIDAESDEKGGGRLFHKFGNKTALERFVSTCLSSEHAQKVVLCMPSADRVLINGSVFQSRIGGDLESLECYGRKPDFFFYGRKEQKLERIFRAALAHELSSMLIVEGANVLIPRWLLNHGIASYHKSGGNDVIAQENSYPSGFGFMVLPFWKLAEHYIETKGLGNLEDMRADMVFENVKPAELPKLEGCFTIESLPIQTISRIFEELDDGIDLADILEGLNEQE